jgi:hypothetical protein
VRGVQCIAHKHHVPEEPAIIPELWEISPARFVRN